MAKDLALTTSRAAIRRVLSCSARERRSWSFSSLIWDSSWTTLSSSVISSADSAASVVASSAGGGGDGVSPSDDCGSESSSGLVLNVRKLYCAEEEIPL